MNDILYIKFDDYIKVNTHKVSLSDVVKLECSNHNIVNKLKETKVFNFNNSTSPRIVYSSLKIIEIIHSIFVQFLYILNGLLYKEYLYVHCEDVLSIMLALPLPNIVEH